MDDVLIKFDDSLRIGNALLDSQHEELFRRANQIFMTPEEERGERIYDAMDFLRTYVLFHFDREESLMAAVAYEVSDEHKAAHGVFRDAVEDVWNPWIQSRALREAPGSLCRSLRPSYPDHGP
jgi:hemerythrin